MLTRTPVDLPDPARPVSEQDTLLLLAMCIFGEARGESDLARRAIAQVILNRAMHPRAVFGSRKGDSFEENLRAVILQPRQFSSLNPFDRNYAKLLHPLEHEAPQVWERCVRCAEAAVAEKNCADTLTMNSDHYFDDSIHPPAWASPAKKTVKIGPLNFYRLYLPRPTGNANSPTTRVLTPSGTAPAPNLAAARPQKLTRAELSGSPPPATPSAAHTFGGDSPAPGPQPPRPNDNPERPHGRLGLSPLVSHPAPKSSCAQISGPGTYRRYDRSRGLSLLLARIGKWRRTGEFIILSERCKGMASAMPKAGQISRALAPEVRRWTSAAKAALHCWVCAMPLRRIATESMPSSPVLALLGLVILTTACSDFERNAYRVLAVTQAEYEITQQRVAEAAVHGLITDEQWTRFEVEGHRFIAAHNAAVDAFALWSQAKSQSNSARLQATLDVLPRLIREINALVASFTQQPALSYQPSPISYHLSAISYRLKADR
ncbi:MAG: cell wall hydrolase [Acidobacteria bacterium]|nr:cell wall hydrolase [Acidobacteriota bacterium]